MPERKQAATGLAARAKRDVREFDAEPGGVGEQANAAGRFSVELHIAEFVAIGNEPDKAALGFYPKGLRFQDNGNQVRIGPRNDNGDVIAVAVRQTVVFGVAFREYEVVIGGMHPENEPVTELPGPRNRSTVIE